MQQFFDKKTRCKVIITQREKKIKRLYSNDNFIDEKFYDKTCNEMLPNCESRPGSQTETTRSHPVLSYSCVISWFEEIIPKLEFIL